MIEENAKKLGKTDARVWNGKKNPNNEINRAFKTYQNVVGRLEPYKLRSEELVSVFALALGTTIIDVENIFPPEISCLKMSVETVIYYAHMDV